MLTLLLTLWLVISLPPPPPQKKGEKTRWKKERKKSCEIKIHYWFSLAHSSTSVLPSMMCVFVSPKVSSHETVEWMEPSEGILTDNEIEEWKVLWDAKKVVVHSFMDRSSHSDSCIHPKTCWRFNSVYFTESRTEVYILNIDFCYE